MAGLPKKYAKMGFKKGWLAFKRRRKGRITKRKTGGLKTMARRRYGGIRRRYKRFAKRKAIGGISFGSVTKILVGAFAAAVYEVFVSPMIPLDGLVKNVVELGVGIMLASMGSMPTAVRSFGAALATINAYSLIVPYVQNWGGASITE